MNSCFESREVLWLRNEIERNKKYLATCTNKAQFQSIQAKTMYLKNEILPIVLNNTMIVHSEVQKYVMRAFDVAVQYNCNSLLLYLPINEEYTDKPIVGIANDKQLLPYGAKGATEISIINMDGHGAKVEPVNLIINPLM